MKNIQHKTWKPYGDIVVITYDDGEEVTVSRKRFNRSFAAIINATKEEVKRDFAL